MNIMYTIEATLDPQAFIDVLRRSGLDARRPVDQPERIKRMIDHANVIVCAWDGTKLVGISRALTDFAFCCYLSDLAVDRDYQRQGIGKELIGRTHLAAGDDSMLLLLAAPAARDYYGHIGMQAVDNGWIIHRKS